MKSDITRLEPHLIRPLQRKIIYKVIDSAN
ncbi:hypothetical protein ES705_31494 [subsurface metagenome]